MRVRMRVEGTYSSSHALMRHSHGFYGIWTWFNAFVHAVVLRRIYRLPIIEAIADCFLHICIYPDGMADVRSVGDSTVM